jgi:hypothetical protein
MLQIHDILVWIRIRGSMPLTTGSGSCYFRHWPSRCQKNLIFKTIFSTCYFLKVHLHYFSKIKSQKESQNSRNQVFSYYFCMMIEWSGSRAGSRNGSIPLTSGSGSGRPKNMWIRRIRIRIHCLINLEVEVRFPERLLLSVLLCFSFFVALDEDR